MAVDSHATALPPFSQNSKDDVCLGSGHAQPGQSKPWGWFMRSSVAVPLAGDTLLDETLAQGLERAPAARRIVVTNDAFAPRHHTLRKIASRDMTCPP